MHQLSFTSMMRSEQVKTFSLVSGSSGNSIFIGQGSSRILVDSGVSAKRLCAALSEHDEDPALLNGIVITHEHSDHIAGLSVLARRHDIPVYMPQPTWERLRRTLSFADRLRVISIQPNERFAIGDLELLPFRISHDAVCPVGYRVDTGQRIITVATDMGEITPDAMMALQGSDLVYLEANYDQDMLLNGPYPWHLKQRIRSERGHLSNDQSASAIAELIGSGSTRFVLAHLSKENNIPELAMRSIEHDLNGHGIVCGRDLTLDIAPRYVPSKVMEV